MDSTTLRLRWLLGAALVLLLVPGPASGGEHPTIHHAGVLRSVDVTAGTIVLDERAWLGPPLLTRVDVSDGTVVIRARRSNGNFQGERVGLDQLKIGDYLVVRGVDRDQRHLAEFIWSLGPAE